MRSKPETNRFGDAVRARREELGFGLRKTAKLAGMSAGYLSQIERGEVMPPSLKKTKKLAKFLNLNYQTLLILSGRLDDFSKAFSSNEKKMGWLATEFSNFSKQDQAKFISVFLHVFSKVFKEFARTPDGKLRVGDLKEVLTREFKNAAESLDDKD